MIFLCTGGTPRSLNATDFAAFTFFRQHLVNYTKNVYYYINKVSQIILHYTFANIQRKDAHSALAECPVNDYGNYQNRYQRNRRRSG